MTSDTPEPWERQKGETDKQFEAFILYRDAGPARAAREVAAALSKSEALIFRWCGQLKWVERASKWDDEADRLQRERDIVARNLAKQKMLDDNVSLGRAMKNIAAKGFRQFDQVDVENPRKGRKIDNLSASDLARYAQIGVQLEREAREGSRDRMDEREAQAWLAGFVDLALSYLPQESHEAFLSDMDAKIGVGSMSTR